MSDQPAVRACVEAVGEAEGYQAAFYELGDLMGIGARALSPETVWRTEMLPRLKAALALPSPVRQGEAMGVTRDAGRSAGPADPSREDASRPTAAAANAGTYRGWEIRQGRWPEPAWMAPSPNYDAWTEGEGEWADNGQKAEAPTREALIEEIDNWFAENEPGEGSGQKFSPPELYEALAALADLFARDGENSLDRFERLAAMFRRDTGYLAPGKDQPRGGASQPDGVELSAIYDDWYAGKVRNARAALAKARTRQPPVSEAKGHAPNCPRFATVYPWECGCRRENNPFDFDFPGGQRAAHQALESCLGVLGFNLAHMITFGDGWNQAVRDAYEKVCVALGHEPLPIHPASVDTHPKDGDALAAPLVSGAARSEAEGDAQNPSLSPVRESVLEEAANAVENLTTDGFGNWASWAGWNNAKKLAAAAIRALKSDPDFTSHIDCPEDEGGRDHAD